MHLVLHGYKVVCEVSLVTDTVSIARLCFFNWGYCAKVLTIPDGFQGLGGWF
jgi:hypothetical protein